MKQPPPADPAHLFDDLGDVLSRLLSYAPPDGEDDGHVDDAIIAQMGALTEAMRGESARRQAYYAAVLGGGRRGHLRLVPQGDAGDDPLRAPPPPVSDGLLREMREVLARLQSRIPLIQLSGRQRNALLTSGGGPLPEDLLLRAADLADRLPREAEGDGSLIDGGQIRAMAALTRRIEKYSVILPPFLRAIDDLSTMMSFELKVRAQAGVRAP